MKAVIVTPGRSDSARVADVPDPVPARGDVVVDVIEVGVCGTDNEIVKGEYGEAPAGDDYLILGHENFGRVADAPKDSGLAAGDLAVCIVRRPDPVPCPQCAAGQFDMCSNGRYTERGIKGRHGFMAERYAESPQYMVKLPPQLEQIGVLIEPLTVVEKAVREAQTIQQRLVWQPREAVVTGAGPIGLMATLLLRHLGFDVFTLDLVERDSVRAQLVEQCGATYVKSDEQPIEDLAASIDGIDLIVEATAVPEVVFHCIDALGPNGVVALTGVSAGSRTLQVPGAQLNLDMVLHNKVVFGSVNANHRHYADAVADLTAFEQTWPGLCEKAITRQVPFASFSEALAPRPGIDVKSTVSFAPAAGGT
jgi:glucose 1-dehydrogenase